MSKWAVWTEEQYLQLGFLIQAGFTNREIGEMMNKSREAIAIKAERVYGGNPNYRILKTKHKHLREPVMRYFVKHSVSETMKRFKLTESEFKSLMTVGYRDKKYKHLRKDKRRHDSWSTKELQFLLQHSGLKPRAWIGRKLKRGSEMGIKDRLETLGISSKSLNGITLSQYRLAFQKEPSLYLKTSAGPGRGKRSATYYKIIPWVLLKQEALSGRIAPPIVMCQLIDSMAMFQEWIFEGNALKKMKRICSET